MLLARRDITTKDTRLFVVDYSEFLARGVVLAAESVTTTAPTSTVGTVSLSEDKTQLLFYVTAGNLNEVFTVDIQITDTSSQVVNDTVTFTVIAP